MPPRIRWNPARRRNFVICGDNPLAHRLADELRGRHDTSAADVTVILPSKRRNHGPQIARLDGVRIIEADDLSDEVLRAARLDTADSVALVEQNDLNNIHVAMRAHELYPDLRLVIRIFDTRLGHYVANMLGSCTVLSDSAVAAPWFVAEALQQLTPSHIRVAGRTLRIVTRAEAGPAQIVCGLADLTRSGREALLPPDADTADLVLAAADGSSSDPLNTVRVPRWKVAMQRLFAVGANRLTLFLAIFLLLLALVAICYVVVGYPLPNAIYLTVLDAAGAANPDPGRGALEKFIQAITAVLGISLIPVLTATVIEAIVRRRFSETTRRLRIRDHVIIVGLGEVGSRVLQQLYDLGIKVVCIDAKSEARGVGLARRLGVPLLIGDVKDDATLRVASPGTARAMLAVTSDDVVNLQAGLSARAKREDLPIVLRLFDGDFAARVQKSADMLVSSRSVSYLAAPSFATAMLERQVIDTIAVGRYVLLVAEVPVAAGSRLEGATTGGLEELGAVRVLARIPAGTNHASFEIDPDCPLAATERLVVVATRDGLAAVVEASFPIAA